MGVKECLHMQVMGLGFQQDATLQKKKSSHVLGQVQVPIWPDCKTPFYLPKFTILPPLVMIRNTIRITWREKWKSELTRLVFYRGFFNTHLAVGISVGRETVECTQCNQL